MPSGHAVSPETLDAARRGDHAAFTEIVRTYDRRFRSLAYRIVGDVATMEDALQDAYLKAYRGLPSMRGDDVAGWLYRIVYNASLDQLRRRSVRMAVPLEDDGFVDPGMDPATQATDRVDLSRALAALSLEQRAAVLLVDAIGLDYDTVAGILEVKPGTVGSRLTRARATLRATLETSRNEEVSEE